LKEVEVMKFRRHAPIDDPVTHLAAGVWVATLSFFAGFLGYVVLVPVG
jgi:hypothetical protein